jgi:hypothetical protein
MFSLGTFQRIFVTKFFKKKEKKGCFAPLCVPLGLKKQGDFTLSEGHMHPLVIVKYERHWGIFGKVKKQIAFLSYEGYQKNIL